MDLTNTQQTTLRRVPFPCSSGEAGDTLEISRDAAYHRLAVLRDKGYVTLDGDNVWHRRDDADIPGEDEAQPAETAAEDADDPEGTPDGVASALHSGLTYDEFETEFDLSQSAARRVMEEMRQEGYTIDFKTVDDKGTRLFFIPDEHDKRFQVGDGDGHYQFAVISDTHLGSRAEHLDELHDFYDRVQARGIDLVFHAGDIGDGWEVHPGHINEIKGEASGWERLLKYVVDNYPSREGVDTLFIEGNHDHKLHRRTGVRFGKRIDEQRDDLHYCGDSMARFVFDPENDIDLELIHPSGGQPYTVGYRLQTLFRERPIDKRPSIAAVGHLHGSMYAHTEGVRGFYAGAWKGLTTYGKRKGHEASVGGWILTLEIEGGEIRSLTPEWIGYSSDDSTANFSLEDISDLVAGE